MKKNFCVDPWMSRRRSTRVVNIGHIGVGGDHPIRVQSMTNTDTMDTRSTVDQIERLAAAGCEIARVTAPSIRDAENLRNIRTMLRDRGVDIPLVADIHFTPNAALIAAEHVEKVRINPGNYADKKKFEVREYSQQEYADELGRVADRFRPLVARCKQNGVAIRIGTNHGSLSDRVMNRYGDSPTGMVESALEFLDVCEEEAYFDVIFSMKASNTHVAIQAYRLLAARLEERTEGEPSYPFHLGVTEAGDSEDGRIKSAIGIGSLLEDGIGDTIRVSLTEDPVREIPVAEKIVQRSLERWARDAGRDLLLMDLPAFVNPYAHVRRKSRRIELADLGVGGGDPVRVELELSDSASWIESNDSAGLLAKSLAKVEGVECESLLIRMEGEAAASGIASFRAALDRVGVQIPLSVRVDAVLLGGDVALPSGCARLVVDVGPAQSQISIDKACRIVSDSAIALEWCFRAELTEIPALVDRVLEAMAENPLSDVAFSVESDGAVHAARLLAALLEARGMGEYPIVLRHGFPGSEDAELRMIGSSIDLGAPLCDGIGDMISVGGVGRPEELLDVAYRILQGARLRTTRTEYISCPSCGRTLFDLEETTARIKFATSHLKGVKIAIMGCIVNGPGEMADADFGYVGSGPGRVTLYAGKDVVARNIAEDEAPERLLALIGESGR
ncbi:MAG TPA: (E)-4-hydroxy-3-methylbut-2-enyl-diphosphate synthase [Myxococcales bacterium]|nr:(E)-4-hydroxy-3-methylbut-2-enyl-diphosphate synthase [Myxococcales bacterium]